MKTLEKGQDKIQKICAILRDQTLEPAQKEAQEIIERALKLQLRTEDHSLVKFMMKMKRISSPFELLQFEKNRVLNTYDKLVHTKSNFSDPLVSANGG